MSRMNEPVGPGQTGEQMREKASQVGQGIRDIGGQVKDTAKEQMENLREQATQYYQQSREKAQQWQENLEGYIQDQPVKSLLIAAGVGFLLGVVWKRR